MYILRAEDEELALFEEGKSTRLLKYPQYSHPDLAEFKTGAPSLQEDGFVLLKGLMDPKKAEQIRAQVDSFLDQGRSLGPVKKRNTFKTSSGWTTDAQIVSAQEMARGPEFLRSVTSTVDVENPLIHFPELLEAALHEKVLNLATDLFGCFPSFSFLKLRRSFVNDLPEIDTNLFHVDFNSRVVVKLFLYLNDVDEQGGPLSYVRGSVNHRFDGWRSKDLWTFEEMKTIYGRENIQSLTANAGDAALVVTSGFHRAIKPLSLDRTCAIFNFVVHEEYGGGGPKTKIGREAFEQLSEKQRAACDFLEVFKS